MLVLRAKNTCAAINKLNCSRYEGGALACEEGSNRRELVG
jgi:hypothetical protein